jgi:hypothetical protein
MTHRPSIGPRADCFLEFLRQAYRPFIAAVCGFALLDQFVLSPPVERMDAASLGILAGLVAALAGLRGWELTRFNGAPA